ncbi:unnamed protein product [Amoebophrya sp. A120]|nr:unnamed protein product [Amoebophrya sp. A120]|eukprot:GSA120T00012474001.1
MVSADGRFFSSSSTSNKRSELQELRDELHSQKLEKKREAVRKVIAAMTVGKDVSSLFPDVINCMQTNSLDLKKLVYLYVVNYSATQPELAILAVNTFRKDSLDPNPLIRALAVRTMGCIRLDAVTEYILEPLRRSCRDQDPYVRKTAVMCIAKLYDIQAELVEEHGFAEILKDLTTDSNPAVVANCVAALSEMSKKNPLYLQIVDQALTQNLLHALNECTEWGQVFILDSLAHSYNPATSRQAEMLLDRVAPRLSHANEAVVMATMKLFLKLMDSITNQETKQVYLQKLRPPLITLLNSDSEIQFVVLRNLQLFLKKYANVFSSSTSTNARFSLDVKLLYCKYNDPTFVKMEKLDLLPLLIFSSAGGPPATASGPPGQLGPSVDTNMLDSVLSELKDYASEVDIDFVRKTIKTIGRIALQSEVCAEYCVNLLMELMDTQVHYVLQEAIITMTLLFRKYPGKFEKCIQVLCDHLETIDEPEARANLIFVLGEHSERIDNADEILLHFLTGGSSSSRPNLQQEVQHFREEPGVVKTVLLTAIVKMFLKSPGNRTQPIVTKCLKLCTEEADDPDLRDRGYMYWRLLSADPKVAKQILLSKQPVIIDEKNSLTSNSTNDKILQTWGSLSSVYRQLPEQFLSNLADQGGKNAQRNKEAYDEDMDSEDEENAVARLRQLQAEMGFDENYKQKGPNAASASNAAGRKPPQDGTTGAAGTTSASAQGPASSTTALAIAKGGPLSGSSNVGHVEFENASKNGGPTNSSSSAASGAASGTGSDDESSSSEEDEGENSSDRDEDSSGDGSSDEDGSGDEDSSDEQGGTKNKPTPVLAALEDAKSSSSFSPPQRGTATTTAGLSSTSNQGRPVTSQSQAESVKYALVLPDTKPGKGGQTGLKIATSLARSTSSSSSTAPGGSSQNNKSLLLFLALQNNTKQTLQNFQLQVNKNFFQLALGLQKPFLDIEQLRPKESKTIVIPIVIAAKTAGTPDSNSSAAAAMNTILTLNNLIVLEAALKTNLDLWYFKIPFELHSILIPDVPLPQAQFDLNWGKLEPKSSNKPSGTGGAEAASSSATTSEFVVVPINPDTKEKHFLPTLLRKFRERNLIFVHHVDKTRVGLDQNATHSFQLGGCFANRMAFFVQIVIRGAAAQVKLRSDQETILPHVQKLFETILKS